MCVVESRVRDSDSVEYREGRGDRKPGWDLSNSDGNIIPVKPLDVALGNLEEGSIN